MKEYGYLVQCPTTFVREFIVTSDHMLNATEVFAAAREQAEQLKITQQILWDEADYYPLAQGLWHRYPKGEETNGS
jgi:hypothetical protein